MISFSNAGLGQTTGVLSRLFVAAAGVAALALAIYRAPVWFESWSVGAAIGAISLASVLLIAAIATAAYGNAYAVKRVAAEVVFLGAALFVAELVLLVNSPEDWSDNIVVQRMAARERAAAAQGVPFDGRLSSDVVRDLRSRGQQAVLGYIQALVGASGGAAGVRGRGLLPLSNVSNANVVECNEGNGYLVFRSDELGFHNPPGIVSGPVDIAVIGESFALGHCVPPSKGAVERIRRRYPRTANFGIAGSRVLSQVAVFREYVAPLEPPVVVWFLNLNFAEAREEANQPLLTKYLDDASFSQHLRERQPEVDALMREVVVPLQLARDEALRKERDELELPLERVFELDEVRRLADFGSTLRRPPPAPELAYFERALRQIVDGTHEWGGEVVLVLLPSYATATEAPQAVARYEAVGDVVAPAAVALGDGVALFDAQPDRLELFTLGIDNHPSERGHALIADAVIAALQARANL